MDVQGDVAVLIPTYNRADLLDHSIRSVLTQTRRPAEIVVIDDGSTDHTAAVAATFEGAVRYLPKPNGGKSAAINAGIAASRSSLILVLDDDDLLPPGALQAHMQALECDPGAGFSYGRYSRFRPGDDGPADSTDVEPFDAGDQRRLFIRLIEHDFLPNPSWLVRRTTMDAVGPYSTDLRRSQDFEMILRLSRQFRGTAVADIVLWQREHEAARGHAGERQKTTHTIDLWVKYDAIMMAAIDRTSDDRDFAPFDNEAVPAATLALQRGVSNFQRNNFDDALEHLARYQSLAGKSSPSDLDFAIGARLLAASHGLGAALSLRPSLADRLADLNLGRPMRCTMASQAGWRFRTALSQRQAGQALDLWRFTWRAMGIDPLRARQYRRGLYPRPRETNIQHPPAHLTEAEV